MEKYVLIYYFEFVSERTNSKKRSHSFRNSLNDKHFRSNGSNVYRSVEIIRKQKQIQFYELKIQT